MEDTEWISFEEDKNCTYLCIHSNSTAWPGGYFFMLNSAEHDIYPAVGILTFISTINTTYERDLKQETSSLILSVF